MALNRLRAIRPRWWVLAALVVIVAAAGAWQWLRYAESSLTPPPPHMNLLPMLQPSGSELSLSAGLSVMADNARYRLSADLERQLFRIEDKRSGAVWDSSPQDAGEDADMNDNTRKMAASPIHLSYTRNFKEISTTQLLRENYALQAFPLENGVQLHYVLESVNISFVIELLLDEQGLEVRIPDEGIREPEDAGLVSLNVFPLLGAARQGDDGYYVVPDGSGALVQFDQPHIQADNAGYSKWVYGADSTFQTSRSPDLTEQVTMPVFGVIRGGAGYAQILTAGATDARIAVQAPGTSNLPYYRGGLEFVVRKMYTSRLGSVERFVPWVERSRIQVDRIAQYSFVDGSEASYAGLAAVVRGYYEQLWQPMGHAADNPLLLRLFMGASRVSQRLFSGGLETVTTFEQAERIIDHVRGAGIADFSVVLTGWNKGGYHGRLPDKLPPARQFGGDDGLRRLVEHARGANVTMSLEDNYLDITEDNGVTLRTDGVRQPNGQLYVHYPLWVNGTYDLRFPWNWLSPSVAEFREESLSYMRGLGVDSVHLRHVGEVLFSDYNRRMPTRRADMLHIFQGWQQEAAAALGSVSVYTGNDYSVRYADAILNSPMSASNHYLFDKQIPFFQMIYHGSKVYYTDSVNRSDVPERTLLRAVEYGAVPAFELTYSPTDRLKYTKYDRLFSSQYEEWMPEINAAYEMWLEVWQPLNGRRMTGHAERAPDVFVTEYDDGTRVWVNYSDRAYSGDGVAVEPLGYAVETKGGGGA